LTIADCGLWIEETGGLDDLADLQTAMDRLRDTTDTVVSSREMRKLLGQTRRTE